MASVKLYIHTALLASNWLAVVLPRQLPIVDHLFFTQHRVTAIGGTCRPSKQGRIATRFWGLYGKRGANDIR